MGSTGLNRPAHCPVQSGAGGTACVDVIVVPGAGAGCQCQADIGRGQPPQGTLIAHKSKAGRM
ncbi:hypothetical protein D8I24_0599 [Cupriavidus necator H850]|nr:hypothetical protein D8I24_0599 [Cupriavidus necator H850]